MILWLPQFYGELELATLLPPAGWHVHEMFFGYLAAVVTGFLFTAAPNWTGRMPIQGTPLLMLVFLWFCGRLGVTFSAYLGWLLAMFMDTAFLTAVFLVTANEILAGKNWRNLKVLLPVLVLLAANGGFHVEIHMTGAAQISQRLAMTAIAALIMIIGGRIIPSITRNWLVQENPGRLPVSFGAFDIASIMTGVTALLMWSVWPDAFFPATLLALAAALHLVQLTRWAGDRALRDPLVAILHIGYLFVPADLALLAASALFPQIDAPLAGFHMLGAGAAGSMTIAVMVRATLGHTGQPLKADPAAIFLFVCVVFAALARLLAALLPDTADTFLHASALLWLAGFAGLSLLFGPLLLNPRTGK